MKIDDKKIASILLRENYVTQDDLTKAKKFAKHHHVSLVEYLLSQGLVTDDLLGQAVAEFYKVPYLNLHVKQPDREMVLRIPEKVGKKFRLVLISEDKDSITVATDDPSQKGLLEQLADLFVVSKATVGYALSTDIDTALLAYRKPLATRFASILREQKRIAPEIIQEIFRDALTFAASDIHFEPQEKEVVIRFRIDGVLHEAGRIPKEYYASILNRIKVQAHLRIDEHFSVQDGAIRHIDENIVVDMRVSIAPILEGEKVTIRLLSQYVRGFTLSDLNLSPTDQKKIEETSRKPFGMILTTGPTGSGKTTTLYALLKLLNRPEVNITTIEDPVEYRVSGVNQIQVNTQKKLTFAKGLRSIVRQDPDVILVGEIRDEETAEIAVNAALTGHLLLSTFHANDAATSIPRLLDMGVEPFLLASTLELVLAQRLVRKICQNCRLGVVATHEEMIHVLPTASQYFDKKTTLYKGKGCKVCSSTGFQGRLGIFEFIDVTREMEDLILTNPSSQQIWKLARSQGARSLFEDGVEKVKNGMTTIEELLRVAAPPEDTK